jgi:AmmeMemoRadiSam system protein B
MSAIRRPAVAGRFYPASAEACVRQIDAMRRPVEIQKARVLGAIVPHAGWVYSGATAALGWDTLAQAKPETVVIFGAVHVVDANHASMYAQGGWETPLGTLQVDDDLARRIARCLEVKIDPGVHEHEHSIEVQLPLVRRILGDVRILPIGVRPGRLAPEIGRICAAEAVASARPVAFVGSTDLTHYGPSFGFEPHGRGETGLRWAKDVNDRKLIEHIAALDAEGVLAEAATSHNACGAGAVAATIGAVLELGADKYVELEHTSSADVELRDGAVPMTSVGYEAGVFVRSA